MQHAFTCVPVSPLRKDPSHTSEMVSQLLFGDPCSILQTEAGNWVKVCDESDGYTGWCQQSHLVETDRVIPGSGGLTKGWVNKIKFDHQEMHIPFGCTLPVNNKGRGTLGSKIISYDGKLFHPANGKITGGRIKKIAFTFINTPYLWGGKSVFGTDCSGFSQAVYKFLNIALPRDSAQQFEMGESIPLLGKAKRGDLVFFDNDEGKIVHVGILLEQGQVIHASGKVRIDHIDQQGILNSSTNLRTHKLRGIRRYF
ncbi:MAG: C40 family peptidase [Ginsengibacter sp.]